MPSTTIRVELEVRDRLRAIRDHGESYNDVLRRILDGEPNGAVDARAPVATRDGRTPHISQDFAFE
jgi:hypothetical protein